MKLSQPIVKRILKIITKNILLKNEKGTNITTLLFINCGYICINI